MSDEEYIKAISKLDSWGLLTHIMNCPTDLTDPYYSKFRRAIEKRYEELEFIRAG